jgi:hypothetical protein
MPRFAKGGEVKDPVSGNPVPPGAKPKEVRDDVPIMASEGEFVIPANVVRFLGLEKIEKMVAKAREALGDTGGGEDGAVEDDELPFDASELQAIPHMAEGGPVWANTGSDAPGWDSGSSGATGTETKQFKNADGQIMFIPYVNGQPLFAVPAGYTENDPSAVSNQAPNPMQNLSQTQGQSAPMDNSAAANGEFVEQNKSPLAGDPKDWGVQDFLDFGKERHSVGHTAAKGMISMMPMGGLAFKAREKWLDHTVAGLFDQMLETGMDPQGKPIDDASRNLLMTTRENLKGRMSSDTGLAFSPMEGLKQAVDKFSAFISGKAPTQLPTKSSKGGGQPAAGTNMLANQNYGGGSSNKSDNQYSGGSERVGSDLGRSPSQGPSSGSMKSGGLYNKGGLVTRRTRAT